MPSDIIGSEILDENKKFKFNKGPIFTNIVLADEINRTPPKTQAALLEAMQEKSVTISGESHVLPKPFFVLATQNPIEQEGTYPLPEAQVDRFMLKVNIDYPKKEEERQIIRMNMGMEKPKINQVVDKNQIIKARTIVRKIYIDEKIEQYILDLVFATRYPKENGFDKMQHLISYGGSPRASINLALAAKSHAFLKKRAYVIPEDVRAVAYDVMRHRIGLTYEAEAENITSEEIISELLNTVEIP
jgi:MoxR-like ATPase